MGLIDGLGRDAKYLASALRTLGRLKHVGPDSEQTATDDIERAALEHPERTAFIFEGRALSYAAFDALANRIAHWAHSQGLQRGETVALFMHNRPEYVAVWYGLSKVGVVTALINSQATGRALAHSLQVSEARHVIVDAELGPVFHETRPSLSGEWCVWASGGAVEGAQDVDIAWAAMSSEAPDPKLREGILGKDIMLKMFTSGTTGLPKAAMITHMRAQNYMHGFAAAGNTSPGDVMLMVLPLYHATGGLCGLGSVLTVGGTCALERKFSASRFWPIAKETGATHFMYVGELCRFLVNAEPNPLERAHAIRCAMGNGLRPDVWTRFQERFAIKDIVEFYGATEGNVSLINFDGRSGAVGRVPWYLKSRFNVRVARFDTATEQLVRGPDGLVVAADVGETGEMLGEIRADDPRFRFDGYAGDDEQTKKKIARDVVKKGDMWFRTGDLMRQDKDGYFYFVDRIGDTYRWKSENVATSEVAEALGVFDGVQQANVYGVEVGAMEGRAGMAALVAEGALDLQALRQHLERELPAFARPLFIRVQNDAASHTTGTFKMRKVDLVKEGFDPREVQDALYFNDPEKGAYVPLDQDLYAAIQDGRVRV